MIGYGLVQWTPASTFGNAVGVAAVEDIKKLADDPADDPEKLIYTQLDLVISSCQPGEGVWLPNMGVSSYGSPCKMEFEEFTTLKKGCCHKMVAKCRKM